MVGAGAKVDRRGSQGITALLAAARQGHTATVQALLDAGANAGLMIKDGDTASRRAEKKQHVEIVELLVAHDTANQHPSDL